MDKCRIAVLLLFTVLWCGFAVAQDEAHLLTEPQVVDTTTTSDSNVMTMAGTTNTSSLTTAIAIDDNHFHCTASLARNCFVQTTPGIVTQISVGFDGYFAGANAGVLYNLPTSVDSYTQSAWVGLYGLGSNNKAVAVGDRYHIYTLLTSTCSGAYQIAKANSALTGKTTIPGCLTQLSATHDGAIAGVNGTTAYYSYNDGANWFSFGGAWTKFILVSKQLGYGISGGYVYRINIPAGGGASWTYLGKGGAVDLAANTIDVWVTDSTNAPWYYNPDTAAWSKMAGFVSRITGGGAFFFGISGTQPYHFVAYAPYVQATTASDYSAFCANQPNGCPIGSNHTVTASLVWSAGGLAGANGSSGTAYGVPQSGLIRASAWDTAFACDIIFGVPAAPYCRFQTSGSVNCSKMGSLFSNFFASIFTDHFRFAFVRVVANGAPYNCKNVGGKARCDNPVKPWCSNTIKPVPWNPPSVDDWVVTNPLTFWDTHAGCVRVTLSSPWHCTGEGFLRTEGVSLPMQPDCSLFY